MHVVPGRLTRPEGAYAYSYPAALLNRQYRDVEEIFSRIGASENVTERRHLLELIIQKLTLRRVLSVLLKADRPLCERCLARYARMALGQVATMLDNLRQAIAVSVFPSSWPVECVGSPRVFGASPNSVACNVGNRRAPLPRGQLWQHGLGTVVRIGLSDGGLRCERPLRSLGCSVSRAPSRLVQCGRRDLLVVCPRTRYLGCFGRGHVQTSPLPG